MAAARTRMQPHLALMAGAALHVRDPADRRRRRPGARSSWPSSAPSRRPRTSSPTRRDCSRTSPRRPTSMASTCRCSPSRCRTAAPRTWHGWRTARACASSSESTIRPSSSWPPRDCRHADRGCHHDRRRREGRVHGRRSAASRCLVFDNKSRIGGTYVDPADPAAPPVFAVSSAVSPVEEVQFQTGNYSKVLAARGLRTVTDQHGAGHDPRRGRAGVHQHPGRLRLLPAAVPGTRQDLPAVPRARS